MINNIDNNWLKYLNEEFDKEYFKKLTSFVSKEYQTKTIYPKKENIFRALKETPIDKVKVVIIGQDPYHGENQANGLSFAVNKGVKFPPSLQNILKELHADLNKPISENGTLINWANQGVLLLNATLTVEASKAGSHQNKGWEIFTDKIIEILNKEKQNLVFILWGSYAHKKGKNIDPNKHLVLKSAHPSPLSVYRGFWESKPFSKTNNYLKSKEIDPIEW